MTEAQVSALKAIRAAHFRDVERIGFIGTGSMGQPMIVKLLQAGYQVNVYDIDPAAAKHLLEKGARWHVAPRDAARRAIAKLSSPACRCHTMSLTT